MATTQVQGFACTAPVKNMFLVLKPILQTSTMRQHLFIRRLFRPTVEVIVIFFKKSILQKCIKHIFSAAQWAGNL